MHTRQSSAFLGFFLCGKKNVQVRNHQVFPWAALGWAVQNFFVDIIIILCKSRSATHACFCLFFNHVFIVLVYVFLYCMICTLCANNNGQPTVVAQPSLCANNNGQPTVVAQPNVVII